MAAVYLETIDSLWSLLSSLSSRTLKKSKQNICLYNMI